MSKPVNKRFVVCVENTGYPASLELRKIYETLPDTEGDRHDQFRIVDESGEDYLYPREYFIPVELPADVQAALRKAS